MNKCVEYCTLILHSIVCLDTLRINRTIEKSTSGADLSCLTLKALLHYALFHSHFGFFSLVSKTRVKTQEKRERNVRKLPNVRKMQENLFILHYISILFSSVFARIFAHKPYQNPTPTHSVIWA